MPWALASPSAPILGEPVPLLGAQDSSRDYIAGLSLLNVLTPYIRHFLNVSSVVTPIFTSELFLTHTGHLLSVPPGQAWQSSGARDLLNEESISGPQCCPLLSSSLGSYTLHTPSNKYPKLIRIHLPRGAEALVQSRFGMCQD